jgi:hypothetical protein
MCHITFPYYVQSSVRAHELGGSTSIGAEIDVHDLLIHDASYSPSAVVRELNLEHDLMEKSGRASRREISIDIRGPLKVRH